MSEFVRNAGYIALSVVAAAGALTVVFSRDVMRMAAGLAVFLLSVAGLFGLHALPFLAVAQIFLYVGGVLIVVLFAIMLVHRSDEGRPALESRHDIGSLSVALGVFVLVSFSLWDVAPRLGDVAPGAGTDALGDVILGPLLPHFEAAGVLLLIALIAVLVVMGGDSE